MLLRNTNGIMVNDTQVSLGDTIENLSCLSDLSKATAADLLDPSDKQNVPKAVSLLQHLKDLGELPSPSLGTAAQGH